MSALTNSRCSAFVQRLPMAAERSLGQLREIEPVVHQFKRPFRQAFCPQLGDWSVHQNGDQLINCGAQLRGGLAGIARERPAKALKQIKK